VNRRSTAMLLASIGLSGVLIACLVARSDLDLAGAEQLLLGLRPDGLAEVILLLGFNSFLAGEKWRLIDHQMGKPHRGEMPRAIYFAFTAIGGGLGQLLPVQVSVALSRSIGAQLYGGRGLARGAAATLLDQLFDLLVAGLLGLASVVAITVAGSALVWLGCALAISAAGLAASPISARLLGHLSRSLGRRGGRWLGGRSARLFRNLGDWALLTPDIARRLFALSLLRFAVLVLVAGASAQAVRLDVPLWQLAAALPFAVFANALAITPGGLGVNEWAAASAIFALGAPFTVAAQWAIVNRVMVAVGAALGGFAGLLIVAIQRRTRPSLAAREPMDGN
jgi:hypothetical protein